MFQKGRKITWRQHSFLLVIGFYRALFPAPSDAVGQHDCAVQHQDTGPGKEHAYAYLLVGGMTMDQDETCVDQSEGRQMNKEGNGKS